MRKLCLLLALLSMDSAVHSQEFPLSAQRNVRGVNDSGECVAPCERSGGRPCRPCLPKVGPGSPDWSRAIAQTAEDNVRFGQEIQTRAAQDPSYRASPDFKVDRKAFKNTRSALEAMNSIRSRFND